jgi:DNA repair protein RadC
MPRGERPNPYQYSFDFGATPREVSQHVRVVKETHVVRAPSDAATYLLNNVYVPFDYFKQEQFYVLLLDNRHLITHDVLVYKGTVRAIYVRMAELFMEAVRVNAPSIILSHCHPSGAIDPSPDDIRTTELAYEAGQLLDIAVLDHILVGKNRWLSFKEKGLAFPKNNMQEIGWSGIQSARS